MDIEIFKAFIVNYGFSAVVAGVISCFYVVNTRDGYLLSYSIKQRRVDNDSSQPDFIKAVLFNVGMSLLLVPILFKVENEISVFVSTMAIISVLGGNKAVKIVDQLESAR